LLWRDTTVVHTTLLLLQCYDAVFIVITIPLKEQLDSVVDTITTAILPPHYVLLLHLKIQNVVYDQF